jgi:hypothetical protein
MTPETPDRLIRRLSRTVEAVHTLSYYTPEISQLTDDGFRGWWHAYFAYRAAPMGPVPAPVVTAAFYNFAPRMVERAVPGVWDIMAPEAILARRQELVVAAIDRIWGDGRLAAVLGEAAELADVAVSDLAAEARPLAAAHAALPRPDGSAGLRLWHACTIWREYRGDGHNIALAAAGIDALESHLLMAAHGRGNQATITGIRGWTEDEWAAAQNRLQDRGILAADGSYTDHGRAFRSEIEAATDELSGRPVANLGPDRANRLQELLEAVTADLLESGAVPGVWPPPTVLKT